MARDKSSAWWGLSAEDKALLQRKRLESQFGGGTAAGAGRAPYFWSQEFGNPRAQIRPKRYISGPGGYLLQFLGRFFEIAIEG